jgi:deoxyribodipyrimidine photo-lyase
MRIVWHRADLRLHDHPGVAKSDGVGVVILDENILNSTSIRRRAWFTENVRALRQAYHARGGKLIVRSGVPWVEIPKVCAKLRATEVHALRSYTPYGRTRDAKVEGVTWHGGCYVHEPGSIQSPGGDGYSVFTPFFKRWSSLSIPASEEALARFAASSVPIDEGVIPSYESDVILPPAGEDAAIEALDEFAKERLKTYEHDRNRLDGSGGSRLSYYFSIGVLSPRYALNRLSQSNSEGFQKWMSEVAWRDFMADLLWRHPAILNTSYDPKWEKLPWQDDCASFERWKLGRTGYPVVDAAMRELRATGFISNRARMIASQFLAKILLIPWQKGECVFKNWLLDGDTAQNVGGWQWSAGLGVDAAPYFRVFNPMTQGHSHDPDGSWIRKWVPESNGSPDPLPDAMIDFASARKRYMDAASRIGD